MMAFTNCVTWIILVVLSSVASETTQSNEECQIANATCKSISTCQYAIRLVVIKNDYKTLRSLFCGFDGNEPKVCCPPESTLNTIAYKDTDEIATSRPKLTPSPPIRTTTVHTTTSSTTKQIDESDNIFPDRTVCGIFQGEDRIYGGSIAAIDEFPWLARIKFLSSSGKEFFACSGSLLTHRYIVTAAHCMTNLKALSVRLGEWSAQTEVDCYNDQCNTKPLDVNIEEIFVFPGYNKRNATRGDIALLRLAESVNFTEFIQPICLPTTDYTIMKDYERDSTYVTAGWGMTELEAESSVKRKLNLNSVPMDICRAALPIIPESSVPYLICAGGKKGEDSCRGDSGGPLVKLVLENYRMNWFLFGITSFGSKNCGSEGLPGIYTRVTTYMNWIRRVVRT